MKTERDRTATDQSDRPTSIETQRMRLASLIGRLLVREWLTTAGQRNTSQDEINLRHPHSVRIREDGDGNQTDS
jgi:hypothetical protein